jgi:hypothetical protein
MVAGRNVVVGKVIGIPLGVNLWLGSTGEIDLFTNAPMASSDRMPGPKL